MLGVNPPPGMSEGGGLASTLEEGGADFKSIAWAYVRCRPKCQREEEGEWKKGGGVETYAKAESRESMHTSRGMGILAWLWHKGKRRGAERVRRRRILGGVGGYHGVAGHSGGRVVVSLNDFPLDTQHC